MEDATIRFVANDNARNEIAPMRIIKMNRFIVWASTTENGIFLCKMASEPIPMSVVAVIRPKYLRCFAAL